ncbi:hypothetical protein DIPPA_25437 [Diplonema papillatum]|nr:hypothetical protein DIPPA_25437 [Diplonema papillatum]
MRAFGSAGAGIEEHQKPDDGRKASQKRKAQSLVNPTEKHSLAAFGSAGAGIEAHQKLDDGRKASQKRKAQSLVNPTEKVRRPTGTRIAS